MYQIPLDSVPNQNISFNVDGAYWQLHIFAAIEHMCADVYRNGELLIQGVRCFGGVPMVPYKYLMIGYGNFIFDSVPDYENFNSGGCNLYYMSESELAEFQKTAEAEFAI
ncbi:hypothetical protein [Escherichia phage ECML-117]|uniref:Cyanophage baseplate Pam3 plug gp18 domain-containing protein n=1 Tax=Escherichia phage ECML-117 TaxID=1204521 RepID=I7A8L4_9CAUD|nr:virion structural protein [Escherichia phage ECML-117]AFO10481.1 hypothetical protein [Escherichia phage ECML-117]